MSARLGSLRGPGVGKQTGRPASEEHRNGGDRIYRCCNRHETGSRTEYDFLSFRFRSGDVVTPWTI